MSKRGWRWRVLEAYPDARCYARLSHDGWMVVDLPGAGPSSLLGIGCTPVMAWRDAWLKIEAAKASAKKVEIPA